MWGYRHRDPAVRDRARDQAAWLIRDHGDAAEAVLEAKMNRPNLTKNDKVRFALTKKALARRRAQLAAKRGETPGLIGKLSALFGSDDGSRNDEG